MQKFILRQNIERYAALLREETAPYLRAVLEDMLREARRAEALLIASGSGVRLGPTPPGTIADRAASLQRLFRQAIETSDRAFLLIEPGPGLTIVEMSRGCAEATLADRRLLSGQRLFDAFPDNPRNRAAEGVASLFDTMRAAAATGRPRQMVGQRYDVRDAEGRFIEKTWRSRTVPMFDDEGRLAFLMNEVEEVFDHVGVGRGARGSDLRDPPTLPSSGASPGP
jgi:hypothetical protein